jgi:hypothetical protein
MEKYIIEYLSDHVFAKVVLFSMLLVFLCIMTYNLGKPIGKAIYYLTH